MRVLIVDDSRAVRSMVGRIMRECGFETFEAGHGLEALERLKEHGVFDLALVDWNMPEMNGYDFLCAVRADAQYAEMRIMMVTSESEMPQLVRALSAGANEYIMKPFTADAMRDKLSILGFSGVAS
ncbi:MAG: response regulator [Gemmatimonas sp.]